MSRVYVGIDIGKEGAIAAISGDTIATWPMPKIKTELDYRALSTLVSQLCSNDDKPHVVFEKLGVIFGSSKQTAFSMGYQSGAVEMACIGLSIPYAKIPAKEWQKRMFTGVDEITKAGTSKRDTKAMALVAAKRLYPNVKLTLGDRSNRPHDGAVDALLMAGYAQIMYP